MITFKNNIASFYAMVATFMDYESVRTQYTNDKKYYEELCAKWGHLTNLSIGAVEPTAAQKERLAIVNAIIDDNKVLNGSTYAKFVEIGETDKLEILSEHAETYKEEALGHYREIKRKELQEQRDAAIASDINNIQVGRQKDRENIEKAIEYFSITTDGDTRVWVMADNTTSDLTKAELTAALEGYWYRSDSEYKRYQAAVDHLATLTTVDEIMRLSATGEPDE